MEGRADTSFASEALIEKEDPTANTKMITWLIHVLVLENKVKGILRGLEGPLRYVKLR
jgi:hypothetical protein